MKELATMTAEELRQHIKHCEELLHYKENERWNELVGDLASAAQKLFNEYPHARLKALPYCEGCGEDIEVEIDLDILTYEDNYIDY